MNLIDVERLVRRIGELMEGRVPEDQARQIAQDYATLSENAAHRLRQCAAMLNQGDEAQALQLADSPPPLLDLVTRLGFRRLGEWRDYCQKRDISCAENLDAKFIRQLNDAYGKGIAPEHQLYRRLREAVQSRDELQIVDALRAIRRRNPGDAGVYQQLERLERKALGIEMQKLSAALAAGDDARVIGLIEEIEAEGFDVAPDAAAWHAAQRVRCRVLLQQTTRLRSRQDWVSASPNLSRIHSLVREENLALDPTDAQTLTDMDAWLGDCQRHVTEERDFARSLGELRTLVDGCERTIEDAVRLSRGALRERLQSMESHWRKLENFRRGIDEDLARRRKKAVEVLESQLDARNRFVRRWAVTGLTLGVAVAAFLGRSFWNHRVAVDLATELKSLREARHVKAAARTFDQAMQHLRRLAGASSSLPSEVDATERFIAAEHARHRQCETLIEQLKALAVAGFDRLPPEQVQARFDKARESLAEVAEDFQPSLVASLASTRARWEEWLVAQRQVREDEFDRLFAKVEHAASALDYQRGSTGVADILTGIEPGLGDLISLALPAVAGLRLPPDAMSRFTALTNRVATFADQVARFLVISNAWSQPRTLEAYLTALQELQRSKFAATTDQIRAADVLAMNINTSSLPAGLLLPGDPEGWRRFELRPDLVRMPSQILPGERTRLNALRDDENLFGIVLHQFTLLSTTPGEPKPTWTAFSRGPLTRNKFGRKVGQVYDPMLSPNRVEFHAREFNSGEYTIVETGLALETGMAERIGLKQLIESGTSTHFSATLLDLLDAINRTDLGSPLCRAFLALKLHELMDLRPHDWDAHWAPQAVQDRNRLRELGAADIASGDWLDARRTAALAPQLLEHFANARRVSYPQQAAFRVALARGATQAGFQLVGNADAVGGLHLPVPLPDHSEIWGWAEDSRAPALLHSIRSVDGQRTPTTVHRSMPFSPLFIFRGDRKKLLEDTRQAVSTDSASLGSHLPPLFSAGHD